jgi:DNA/RNA endonuclease G (NUC1)
MPNAPVSRKKVTEYRVPIKSIEARTGLKFLTNLTSKERTQLFYQISSMWRTHY